MMPHDDFSCDPRKWSSKRLYEDRSGFEAVRLEKNRRTVPNAKTVAAIEAGERGDVKKFATVDEMFAAQGIEAGTDETLQAAQPEGREPGPKDAPNLSSLSGDM